METLYVQHAPPPCIEMQYLKQFCLHTKVFLSAFFFTIGYIVTLIFMQVILVAHLCYIGIISFLQDICI